LPEFLVTCNIATHTRAALDIKPFWNQSFKKELFRSFTFTLKRLQVTTQVQCNMHKNEHHLKILTKATIMKLGTSRWFNIDKNHTICGFRLNVCANANVIFSNCCKIKEEVYNSCAPIIKKYCYTLSPNDEWMPVWKPSSFSRDTS